MNNEHQALADVPLWLLVLLSMAGLSGEMLRASGADLSLRQILQRVFIKEYPAMLWKYRMIDS